MANFLQDSFFEFCECLLFVHQLWTLVLWSSQASQISVVATCAVCGMRSAEYHLALLPLLSVYSRSTSHRHSAATSARSLAPGHRRPHTQHRSRVIANAFAALARTKSGGIQRGVRLHIAGISSCTNRVSPFLSCGVLLLRVIQSAFALPRCFIVALVLVCGRSTLALLLSRPGHPARSRASGLRAHVWARAECGTTRCALTAPRSGRATDDLHLWFKKQMRVQGGSKTVGM